MNTVTVGQIKQMFFVQLSSVCVCVCINPLIFNSLLSVNIYFKIIGLTRAFFYTI